jgi:hypothetical protein
MRDERAVAALADVNLEDVRSVLDGRSERLEGVLDRSGAIAAMRDAERLRDGERLGDAAAQRREAQGSSEETSTSS